MALHPETIKHAAFLASEFLSQYAADQLLGDDRFPTTESYYRAKWNAIATGEFTPTYYFDRGGIGAEATVEFAMEELCQELEDEPAKLQLAMSWLSTWFADQRRGAAA